MVSGDLMIRLHHEDLRNFKGEICHKSFVKGSREPYA